MAVPTPKSQLGLLFFSMFALTVSSLSPSENPPSVYEILSKFGLPSGLLPDNVKSYTISDDGNFVVELQNECYVQFDDYLVYYDKKITGKLSIGSITDLDGIEVKSFLFWFDVDEIKVDLPPSDHIYFQVGIINKKLDVDQFQNVHSCRDSVFGSCGQSFKKIVELAAPTDEIPMLITE